jgi:hypothetical protein
MTKFAITIITCTRRSYLLSLKCFYKSINTSIPRQFSIAFMFLAFSGPWSFHLIFLDDKFKFIKNHRVNDWVSWLASSTFKCSFSLPDFPVPRIVFLLQEHTTVLPLPYCNLAQRETACHASEAKDLASADAVLKVPILFIPTRIHIYFLIFLCLLLVGTFLRSGKDARYNGFRTMFSK